MLRQLLLAAMCLSTAWALRLPAKSPQSVTYTRRGMMQAAGALATFAAIAPAAEAAPSEIAEQFAAGKLTKEEFYAAAKVQRDLEAEAMLPVNQLKALRSQLSTAPKYIEGGDWNGLRDLFQETTGSSLLKRLKEAGVKGREAEVLTAKVRKALYDVDLFAYSQQSILPAALSGYCADGVVPRDEKGGCKLKPKADTAPLIAKVQDALAAFDELIKLA